MKRVDVMKDLMAFMTSVSVAYRNEKEFRDDMSLYFQKLGYIVHVEYPVPMSQNVKGHRSFIFVDLVLEKGGDFFPIELKYKTKALSEPQGLTIFNNPNIPVQLIQDSATNDNCFSIWKDVQRIETLASSFSTIPGCTVVLTNGSLYWRGSRPTALYNIIAVKDGTTMPACPNGIIYKGATTASNPLILKNSYPVNWKNTSREDFRYLILG